MLRGISRLTSGLDTGWLRLTEREEEKGFPMKEVLFLGKGYIITMKTMVY